jgi:hypothetical protein
MKNPSWRLRAAAAGALGVALAAFAASAQLTPPDSLDVARFTTGGKMQKPPDLANWIFLGASLGMGYNPGSFNAARPGQFQVAMMEPAAWRYFLEHGRYAPGSMFLLAFYDADVQPRSVNQNGFTQADLTNFEIHLIDAARGPDGHAFYMFGKSDVEGAPLPPGNACVRCHVEHGAFDGTFAQFYPTLRPMIPKALLEKAANDHNIR